MGSQSSKVTGGHWTAPGPNPDFPLWGRTSASAECRHWSGRAVRWSSCAILLRRVQLSPPPIRWPNPPLGTTVTITVTAIVIIITATIGITAITITMGTTITGITATARRCRQRRPGSARQGVPGRLSVAGPMVGGARRVLCNMSVKVRAAVTERACRRGANEYAEKVDPRVKFNPRFASRRAFSTL
jgi:hypothetical protein